MAAIVDTNVLVYCYDEASGDKQAVVHRLLRSGIAAGTLSLPHQVLVEFTAVVTRSRRGPPLLDLPSAIREAEELLQQFPILYPDEELLRTAWRGMAAYQMSWFDAHLWAYAERYGIDTLFSEDFQHGRRYGRVRIENPF